MAVSTKSFTLVTTGYQDISEGNENCTFRMPLRSFKDNAIRVNLGTSLPAAGTVHYDLFGAADASADERVVDFNNLEATDRVYVRLDAEPVKGSITLTAYRK